MIEIEGARLKVDTRYVLEGRTKELEIKLKRVLLPIIEVALSNYGIKTLTLRYAEDDILEIVVISMSDIVHVFRYPLQATIDPLIYTLDIDTVINRMKDRIDNIYKDEEQSISEDHQSVQKKMMTNIVDHHPNMCSICGGSLEYLLIHPSLKDKFNNVAVAPSIYCDDKENRQILKYCTKCGLVFIKKR